MSNVLELECDACGGVSAGVAEADMCHKCRMRVFDKAVGVEGVSKEERRSAGAPEESGYDDQA